MALTEVDLARLNDNVFPATGSFGNRLINGDFSIAQRGTSFSGGTTNADDTYTLDRWYVLSEGSDTIDVSQETTEVPTGGKYSIALDVETTGEKFGIAQIIEGINCVGLIGNTATLSFKAKVSDARIDTVKAAIVSWSGTENTVTSDIISAWNADGTTPTLIANATFENTPADLGVTTSWATYSVTADIDTASTANVIVFIWSDDATNPTAGDFFYLADVQLEIGDTVTPFEHRPIGTELTLCQRYFYKGDSIFACAAGLSAFSTGKSIAQCFYPTTMRATPTLSGASYLNSSEAQAPSIGKDRITFVPNPSSGSNNALVANYELEAEL